MKMSPSMQWAWNPCTGCATSIAHRRTQRMRTRRGDIPTGVAQLRSGDEVVNPVGAEDEDIALGHGQTAIIDLDAFADPQRARQIALAGG